MSERRVPKIQLIMRLTTIILIATIMQVNASSFGQRVSLDVKNAPLNVIIKEISKQTGYEFFYDGNLIKNTKPVSIKIKNATIENALELCFTGQSITYKIENKVVSLKPLSKSILDKISTAVTGFFSEIDVSGRVVDEKEKPLIGATVKIINTNRALLTDENGAFEFYNVDESAVLLISYIGYQSQKVPVKNSGPITIKLKEAGNLSEIQVIGYGQVSRKFNTGNVSTITSKDLEKQPVTNVLSALSGRLPGVFLQTTNGLPGGNIEVQIGGKGSITAGTNPLYVVDGVPFPGTSLVHNTSLSDIISGEISPLNSINPNDIESINVLKDADATAIYGSRGANGVVLITTKKGIAGKTKADINISSGVSEVASFPKLLKLSDYLTIRREAFKNDGLEPSTDPSSLGYAPDLKLWSQTDATDWGKYIMGRTGRTTNVNASLSGGSEQTKMLGGINYRNETSVLRGDNKYQRGGARFSLQHHSIDNKFNLSSSLSYTADDNNSSNPKNDFLNFLLLPPNFPLYNQNGELNWATGSNPIAAINNYSKTRTGNTVFNTTASLQLLKGLTVKTDFGFNQLEMSQIIVSPKSGSNPNYSPTSQTTFGDNLTRTFIIEPQINYSTNINKSSLNFLAGGTYQKNSTENQILVGTNFNSESLLENPGSASTITPNGYNIVYKYVSLFGRVSYNFDQKYFLNVSGRRDGSSRFGIDHQFGNFGAIGAAWLISNENWLKDKLRFLYYAKIRGSYGITGNDQIADYQYLSTYRTSGIVYQNQNGLEPARIANDNYHWESNKKTEVGLEVGLFDNRFNFTISHFENVSGDQLVNYTLPLMTGFTSYQANLPAKVRNSGWELELNSTNFKTEKFNWSTNFNITFLKNRLISFPDIESSSYSKTLVVGESVQRATGFMYLGTDPATGSSLFKDKDGNSTSLPDFDSYYSTIGRKDPSFYGGMGNTFSFKGFRLDVFFQFAKQGISGSVNSPGTIFNSFDLVKNRWQNPNDLTITPKASTSSDFYYTLSSANFFNSTYLRLKNVQISYAVSDHILKKIRVDRATIYIQAQNLATWWNKNNALYDPESGASSNIPPLQCINLGVQFTF
ncbi:SusC/RagA family TonB-linked outer membrane protein [Pedobacter sp. WC2423]|uniref:SusC/RagA family TonB-linked outer membrane protein n=1 Tax=Pedobacter sp. WC2423 TaxID=3234142 RepID=UPI003466A4D0